MSIPPDVLIPIQIGLTLLFEIVCQYSIRAVALLNLGGVIAQFKRNDCSISPVEVIWRGGVRREVFDFLFLMGLRNWISSEGNFSGIRKKPFREPSELNIQKLKYIRWCAL